MSVPLLGPREETPQGLWHPEYRAGWRYWTDGSTEAVMAKVRFGDPVKGWEGDERLALYASPTDAGMVWELCRLEHDGEYRLVARSQPGVPFNETIIDHLIAHDRRRGYDPHVAVARHNEALHAARDSDDLAFTREEFNPRMAHALERDS